MSRRSIRPVFGHSMVSPAPRSGARPGPNRRTTLRLGGSLLVLAPLLAACSGSSDAASEANAGYVSGDGVVVEIPPEGRAEPLEIRGTTYSGDDFDSTALRGAPLLINVWYASCPPCRVEAPALKSVHSEYGAQGVEFVGVRTGRRVRGDLRHHLSLDPGPRRRGDRVHGRQRLAQCRPHDNDPGC